MKDRKPAMGFIFIVLLLSVTGMGVIIPIIPKLISELTGSDLSGASVYSGWLLFSYSIMQFIFSPLLGNLSDRFGRRPVLLLSLTGFGLDFLVLAFAPNIVWLFIARILSGIMGASFTTASAYIADISTPENRSQNFGMLGVAFGVGFIIGPVLGGILGQFGTRVPFIAAAVLSLLNALYGYFILPESLAKENRRKFEFKRANPVGAFLVFKKYPVIIGLVVSLFFIYMGGHAVNSTWTFFTMEVFKWNEAEVGYSLGFVGILVALVQGLLIRYLNPRLGQKRSIYIGLSLTTIGFVLFSVASSGWMIYLFLLPYCLGGIAGPSIQSVVSGQVSPSEQGELQGALTSLMSVTAILGPVIMTHTFSFFTHSNALFYFPGAAFILGAILSVLSIFFAMRTMKQISG